VSVQKVEIVYYSNRETLINNLPALKAVIIDDKKRLNDKEIETLAQNDGFNTIYDFFAYFNEDFTGKLIHWTDLKY
jgi:ribonuclease HIII